MLTISKFTYKNIEPKIHLHHPLPYGMMPKLRKVNGFGYSATHKSWYVSYTNTAFSELKQIEPNLIILQTNKKNTIKNAVIIIDKKQKKIQLNFNNDELIKKELDKIENSFRINNYPKWVISGTNENYLQIIKILNQNKFKYKIEYKKDIDELQVNPIVKHYVQTMIMRNNSKKTIEIYTSFFKVFVKNFDKKEISKLTYNEINTYVKRQIKNRNLSEQQQKQLISAIKYYYEKIHGRKKMYFNLQNKTLIINHRPEISIPEIIPILEQVKNIKAKLFILFYYSLCIDFSEIAEFTLDKSKKLLINTFQKYPEEKANILQIVKDYYEQYKPEKYFFETKLNKTYSKEEIKSFIYKITSKYKLVAIYNKVYFQICKQIGLNENSTKNYISYFLTFLKKFNFTHPLIITNEQIRNFLLELNKGNYSKNTINQYINTIKLYYNRTEKRIIQDKFIYRPKREKALLKVLSKEEITKILSVVKNIKHYAILSLTYSGGLRRSETLNLKIEDIDFEQNIITIRKGKGKKDRITMLSDFVKKILPKYLEAYKPKKYLFEGITGGKYSTASFRNILKNAARKAGIKKTVTIHILRHSFATHLMEQGTDIRFIQKILGHNNIKTTVKYTHVANNKIRKIKNPLDNL